MAEAEGTPQVETPVAQEGTETPQVETPQYTEIEQAAIAQGWQDKKTWVESGHAEEDHRSAREFIDRGELLGKVRATSNEVRELRQSLQAMTEHNRKVFEAGVEEGIKRLQTQRKAALKEGDFDNAVELEEEIDRRKETLQQVKQSTVRPQQQNQGTQSPEFQAWVVKNPWYLKDPVMHHWANAMAVEFTRVNPQVTEEEVYKFLDRETRKEFPHKFNRAAPPSPESGGRRGSSGGSGGGKDEFEMILAEMDPDEAKMARRLVANGHLTKEKYVADLKAVNKRRG